jgi:hypothetical protein
MDQKTKTADGEIFGYINVWLVATVFCLLGVLFLTAAILKTESLPGIWRDIVINVGCGFLTAGILAFTLEVVTQKSNLLVINKITGDVLARISNLLLGPRGLQTVLHDEIQRESMESRILFGETVRSTFTEDIQKQVFAAGLVGAFPLWLGRVPEEFLDSEVYLRIMLKDGYTFFSERKEALKKRFRQAHFHTKILILHPESPYIPAVAQMDPVKETHSDRQVNDCLLAIKTMQTIRRELMSEESIDIAERVEFLGYPFVPTWNGFIGSSLSYISFFFTRPYRGELNTLVIRRTNDRGQETNFFGAMFREYEEIWRHVLDLEGSKLFEYEIKP